MAVQDRRLWPDSPRLGVNRLSRRVGRPVQPVQLALDWSNAFAGAILNIIILVVLWLGPLITRWAAH
jgi:hypothetical protein